MHTRTQLTSATIAIDEIASTQHGTRIGHVRKVDTAKTSAGCAHLIQTATHHWVVGHIQCVERQVGQFLLWDHSDEVVVVEIQSDNLLAGSSALHTEPVANVKIGLAETVIVDPMVAGTTGTVIQDHEDVPVSELHRVLVGVVDNDGHVGWEAGLVVEVGDEGCGARLRGVQGQEVAGVGDSGVDEQLDEALALGELDVVIEVVGTRHGLGWIVDGVGWFRWHRGRRLVVVGAAAVVVVVLVDEDEAEEQAKDDPQEDQGHQEQGEALLLGFGAVLHGRNELAGFVDGGLVLAAVVRALDIRRIDRHGRRSGDRRVIWVDGLSIPHISSAGGLVEDDHVLGLLLLVGSVNISVNVQVEVDLLHGRLEVEDGLLLVALRFAHDASGEQAVAGADGSFVVVAVGVAAVAWRFLVSEGGLVVVGGIVADLIIHDVAAVAVQHVDVRGRAVELVVVVVGVHVAVHVGVGVHVTHDRRFWLLL
mmetsp:Transcript_24484/g.68727  ORF Transcript_24484/g.68727 Transcript_24484/m.68727 type:complete len:478 (-) Transcript_24484:210-1643(-)